MTEQLVVQLEGEYNYVEKERNYCQETFKLVLNTENNHYIVLSEIFSRMDSGELLKINVRYEMNQYYFPINVKITRSLGKKFAQETFFLDTTSQTLRYHFQNDTRDQNFSMPATTKHYISMITSKNIWDYVAPPEDQIIYADFKTRELTDFKINKTELSAMLLHLYQGDSNSPYHEEPTQIYLSKHYNIPYQLIHGDQQILVKSLKKIS
jgi:hypothetical protein